MDEHDLQEEYKSSASTTVGGPTGFEDFTGSFTASSDFKNTAKTMNKGENGSAYAMASCVSHSYRISKSIPPCMSRTLMTYIDLMLESPGDEDIMNDFFDTFGTHAILSVDMGDKFLAKTSFKNSDYTRNKANGGEVKFDVNMGIF